MKNINTLRYGYTTGSCATAAAFASVEMLFTQSEVEYSLIILPSGEMVKFFTEDIIITKDYCSCTVVKDAGDDPDVTNLAKINVKVSFCDDNINILGGDGVGVVTKEGLAIKVNEPAINPVPLKMITENVNRLFEKYNYKKGVNIVVSVENGEEIAKKTFNERLGIIGGISILGTSGIVKPMSDVAIIDTIKAEIDVKYYENKDTILITPGNYGEYYCKNNLKLDINKAVTVSNYLGIALDYISYKGYSNILLVGHIGKLVKVAGGIMNTHSSVADGRMEIIAANTAKFVEDKGLINKILDCVTTDEAFDIIRESNDFLSIKDSILEKVMFHLNYRLKNAKQNINIGVVLFNNKNNDCLMSENAKSLINILK